jgi:hypothetical protein
MVHDIPLIHRRGLETTRQTESDLDRQEDSRGAVQKLSHFRGAAACQSRSGQTLDSFWRSLCFLDNSNEVVKPHVSRQARFWELPALAARAAGFPDEADFGRLRNPIAGHNDPNSTDETSLFWGILYLIHRVNQRRGVLTANQAGQPSFSCGDGKWAHVVGGGAEYNARIDSNHPHTKYYLSPRRAGDRC